MLVDQHGNPLNSKPKVEPRRIRARYDAASGDADNANHWAMADSLSAVRANSESVRRRLRERSRYEVANNSYARGALDTLAAYTVGQGPTLQLNFRGVALTPDDEREMRSVAQQVELLYSYWSYSRCIADKLRTVCLATNQDGESFALFTTSAKPSSDTPVELDVRLYEADQFADQGLGTWQRDDSGVQLGLDGEPTAYSVLEQHPGDYSTANNRARWLPAEMVLHCFRRERPGQLRGIPRTTPALPLFAQLRRYILATITAAETAADFAAIMYQDGYSDTDEATTPWDRVPIERGAMLTVPGGSRIAQLKAEHPTATFDEFVRAILREIARAIGLPAVLMLGDASSYNYSSGRLDLQSFQRMMATDRSQILERQFLDRIFEAWLAESLLIPGFLPEAFAATASDWDFGWRWEMPEHVDREKEANGQQTELANMTTTLSREYSRRGQDWEVELRQRARELALISELGLTPAQAQPQQPKPEPQAN